MSERLECGKLRKREMDVLDQMIGGKMTNDDIAQELGISAGTVAAHITRITALIEEYAGDRPRSKQAILYLLKTRVGDRIIPDDDWADH
ncbi:hypothetical protein A2691_01485 [Candidatus Woesebacteria bacterium RIFCSPHIGHO2_01_FULL_39_23]|nr:MAG: hypothetical protein A2691_01485 [Candidatus Woesebacteria bacterium RIFCSPHIGHO2_01_FULL_39_23]